MNTIRTQRFWRSAVGVMAAFAASASGCWAATAVLSPDARRDLEVQPGVVRIVVSFEATLGPFTAACGASGSGFLYRPDGYLITNGHVAQWAKLNDSNAAVARLTIAVESLTRQVVGTMQKRLGRILTDDEQSQWKDKVIQAARERRIHIGDPSIVVVLDNQERYQGEIKAYSDPVNEDGKDIAIIKIDGRNLPTVALGASEGVNVGDSVTVVGYPGAAEISNSSALVPTVTHGRISAVNKQDYKGTPVLQSEAPINHGNSGGPAFDAEGRVIGVATYSLKEGAQLNFFVPVDTAMEFVRSAGAPPERGPFDERWHSALEAYAAQKWSTAHERMAGVLEIMPGQPDAKRLQMAAAQNAPSNPVLRWMNDFGTYSTLTGIAVLMVAVLAFAGVLMMRSRHKPVAPPRTIVVSNPAPVISNPAPVVSNPAPLKGTTPEPVKPVLAHEESYGSLQISNGPLAGNRFVIPKKGLVIGRDPASCAVVLPSDAVSKQHVWVVPIDNGVAVIDHDSVNGTYVNSTASPRINKVLLKDGDRIYVGRKNATEIMYFTS